MKSTHFLQRIGSWLLLCHLSCTLWAAETNPAALTGLLNRIGGEGTASRFVTIVDATLSTNGQDVFVITSQSGKPCIKGNTTLSVATGINWYLNHQAHVNLAWNNLTQNLSTVTLPTPSGEERHTCSVDYRYYLNYCTFSYSMSTWTWERWQQEIDWMALHGINMPLQIVGLDAVWMRLLTEDLKYTKAEANKFIAGPCFQAWWGMNNLEGWGGPNPDWWYTRQEQLAKQILARQRELGMQPVLPGYAGMVPSDITSKGYAANNQGKWCAFVRPYILDPNSQAFTDISALYYKRLEEVMGKSEYYSMDPFHEGANTEGIDVASAYTKIAKAMTDANSKGKWVIQFWQWSGAQYNVLSKVEKGKLIVLDLFSDAHTHFGDYQGHDAVYCMLPNFGGRTGLFGRLSKVMTEFYNKKNENSNLKGIGATPEAIEQVPVLYDALFELPWQTTQPDPKQWLADYTVARYGADNQEAKQAWELIRNSALNCETALQGPHEAVLCARPSLQVDAVSSWGGTGIFYNSQDVADAAYRLLSAKKSLSGQNYSYDLTDFTRQALTDYGYYLLQAIKQADDTGDKTLYAQRRDAYLQLILDIDRLLNTNSNFMVGRWTQMARGIADETTGTTDADREWLELNNARTLITTWGAREQSEAGGLRDYSYREWGGMMKDFYYNRWKQFFDNRDNNKSQPDWFTHDWNWAHNADVQYTDESIGVTADVATELFEKYFINVKLADGERYHVYRYQATDARSTVNLSAIRGDAFTFPVEALPEGITAKLGSDFNNDGRITADEQADGLTLQVPTTAVTGKVMAQLMLSDGTTFTFRLSQKDLISTDRTVTVKSADETQGSVCIEGTDALSVTGKDEVTLIASPISGYDFLHWSDAQGQAVSTDNPYTYFGAAAADFTANFIVNKWGAPTEDLSEIGTIKEYGQFLTEMNVCQNGGEKNVIYTTNECPAKLCQTTQAIKAPKGSQVNLSWVAKGMNYCRLSAYVDTNSDGDFDDEGEFIGVIGTKANSGNTMLNDYTLPVLLPYEIPEGITHIRLRFDGAWQGGLDATTDAMPAKAKTMRMVYDIPVNVTTQAQTACTVTVKTSDATKGTVDANGQPDTYTYSVGEEVVLRCYPVEGYVLRHWIDQYKRIVPTNWMDGNFLRFHAPESGTYTAVFGKKMPEQLSFNGWTFDYEMDGDAITLTKVVNGEGALMIPANYEEYPIVALASGLLNNQKTLTALTLPASVESLGSNLIYSGNFKGAGVQNAAIVPTTTISGIGNWTINLYVTTDGSKFNTWGSGLLATGSNALADSYADGFQLYLKADGSVDLKMESDVKKEFTNTKGKGEFQIALTHTAAGNFSVKVTTDTSEQTYLDTDCNFSDITTFSTSIPIGVNLTSITITDPTKSATPFKGCEALASLKVATGNKAFKATSNVLYTADGTRLIAYPEGRLSHRLTLPSSVKTIGTEAFTVAPQLERIITTAATPAKAEIGAFGAKGFYAQVPTAKIAEYRAAWGLPLVFNLTAGTTLTEAVATQIATTDAVDFNATDASTAKAPTIAEDCPVWLTRRYLQNTCYFIYFPTAPMQLSVEGHTLAETPLAALIAWRFQDGKFVKADALEAGAYIIAIPEAWSNKQLTFRFAHLTPAAQPLTGWTGNGTGEDLNLTGCYTYDKQTNSFTYSQTDVATLRPFQSILAGYEGCPATITGPDLTILGISDITIDASGNLRLYDLQGRPTHPTQSGIFIREDGRKLIK